ncbi:MAG: hypothetical protein AAGE80_12390 [Pseudomonadota bacterium]
MSDVIMIAKQRRDELCAEFERLEEFIKTAESLVAGTGKPMPTPAPVVEQRETSASNPAEEETAEVMTLSPGDDQNQAESGSEQKTGDLQPPSQRPMFLRQPAAS